LFAYGYAIFIVCVVSHLDKYIKLNYKL
jgi:hypothetical protein